jgi:hypothetical protein
MQGRLILSYEDLIFYLGKNLFELKTTGIAPGAYIIRIINGCKTGSALIIKD